MQPITEQLMLVSIVGMAIIIVWLIVDNCMLVKKTRRLKRDNADLIERLGKEAKTKVKNG